MAERHSRKPGPKRQEVRGLIESYTDLIGPGGITAYVPLQDLLVLTDFNTVVLVTKASGAVPMFTLRSVSDYAMARREYPGAQILRPNQEWGATDIRNRSVLSEKSIHVMEVCALAQAQKAISGRDFRSELSVLSRLEDRVILFDTRGIELHVGRRYYDALLAHPFVDVYSGVLLSENEPTRSWARTPVQNKGVYFESHNLYGLVMPHANVQRNSSDGGTEDAGAGLHHT